MKADESIGVYLDNKLEQHPTKLAFAEYDQTMNNIFKAYLKSKTMLYQKEKRWAEETFWKNVTLFEQPKTSTSS